MIDDGSPAGSWEQAIEWMDQVKNETEMQSETIDLTPSWKSMVGLFVTLIENGGTDGRRAAIEELDRMASLADAYVESQKN